MAEAQKKEEIAKRVIELRQSVERSGTLRAQAEASLSMAKTQLTKVDEQLKALGVDPGDAERQVGVLETALDKKITQMQGTVNEEIIAFNKVVESSKQVFS